MGGRRHWALPVRDGLNTAPVERPAGTGAAQTLAQVLPFAPAYKAATTLLR